MLKTKRKDKKKPEKKDFLTADPSSVFDGL